MKKKTYRIFVKTAEDDPFWITSFDERTFDSIKDAQEAMLEHLRNFEALGWNPVFALEQTNIMYAGHWEDWPITIYPLMDAEERNK